MDRRQRRRWCRWATSSIAGPDSLKIIRQLMKLQREARDKGGGKVIVAGRQPRSDEHDRRPALCSSRRISPPSPTRDSRRARDRVYEANGRRSRPPIGRAIPKMTPEAIRDEWMKATPLGMLEHQAAWRPDGEIGKWVIGQSGGGEDRRHACSSMAGSAPPMPRLSLEQINRRVADALKAQDEAPTVDHQRSRRAALVSRADHPRRRATRRPSRRFRRERPCALTIDQEIDLVARQLRREADRRRRIRRR